MNQLGKRIIVFTMIWALLVMAVAQVYDNVTGRGMPPKKATPIANVAPTIEPDANTTKLAELQSCVAANPDNLQCNLELADFYYGAEQWAQAQVNYERAVLLDPHNVTALLRLAGTYIYQDKFTEATATLQEAAALQPDSPEIHLLLGLALSKLEPPQTARAIEEWRKVISLDPKSPWATQATQYISEAGK